MTTATTSTRRLGGAILLFAAIYAGYLTLYHAAIGSAPAGAPLSWHVWRILGAVSLFAGALEFSMFLIWLWQRWMGFSADGGVPLRLTPAHRRLLDQRRPALALLMPAHNEATTPHDRDALVERIVDVLRKTPAYSTLFLLVDSPHDQRENETAVIRLAQARLRGMGCEEHISRLAMEEYRDKPPDWRHKSGSILRWIQRFESQYEFMFILDADSSLPDEDPAHPRTCDVVERMLVTMLADRDLAMIQAAMHIRDYHTPWGWTQSVNARVGTAYYLTVFSCIYGRATPCYGHNCLLRVSDFARHVRNTLHYTSHDHIDAGDLAAAGRGCVISDAVLTHEEPEHSLLLWLKRECRWSRGNGQWIVYLLRKRGLPLAPIVYLILGIAQYLLALITSVYVIFAVTLSPNQRWLFSGTHLVPGIALIGLIAFTLTVPRYLASPSFRAFAGSMAISLLLGPALMMFQGMAFVLGAFGTRWIPRGSRSNSFDLSQILRTAAALTPIALLGLLLWPLTMGNWVAGLGGFMMRGMLACMIASPIMGVLVSWPWKQPDSAKIANIFVVTDPNSR